MALRVWLPLNGNLNNQGLDNFNISGTPTFVNGKTGLGLDLSKQITFTASSLTGLKAFSCCFWYKVNSSTALSGNWMDLICFNTSNGSATGTIRSETCYSDNYKNIVNGCWYGVKSANLDNKASKDIWYHMAFTTDGVTNKAYLNGVLQVTSTTGSDYLEHYLTGYVRVGETNNINAIMNDLRIYDECLSQKEVKEISKGLVAHYKLDSPYIEKTSNLAPGIDRTTNFTINNSPAWDTTLNGTPMINPSGWGTGYNGGVTDPTHGYHAHWIRENGQWMMIFPNLNSVINQKGRWLGISSGVSTKDILAGEKYTISWWQKTDNLALAPWGGVYYKKTSDGSYNFYDGCPTFGYNTKLNTWEFMSRTFTRNAEYVQHDASQSIYVYGGNSNEGTMYVKDVQIQRGDYTTPYAIGTRNGLTNAIDYSGNGYNGQVSGTLNYNPDSARYSGSTKFDGSSAAIKIPFNEMLGITEASKISYSLSFWFYVSELSSKGYATILGGPSGFEIETKTTGDTIEPRLWAYSWGGGKSSIYTLNEWHHVGVSIDVPNNQSNWYLDGSLAFTGTVPNTPIGDYFIGAWKTATQQNFKGSINDFKIYATALSADDILTMYKNSGIIDNKGNVYAYEFKEE